MRETSVLLGLYIFVWSACAQARAADDASALFQQSVRLHNPENARLDEAREAAMDQLETLQVNKVFNKLTGNNKSRAEMATLVSEAFSSDRLLGRLEPISRILPFNITVLRASAWIELNKTLRQTKMSSSEFVIPMIQEFFITQKHITEMIATSLAKVVPLIHISMPDHVKLVVAPHIDKFIYSLQFPLYSTIRDFDKLIVTPKSKFCKAVSGILRNTSLVQDNIKKNMDECNRTRDAAPSLMKGLVEPEMVESATNVTIAFLDGWRKSLSRLSDIDEGILTTIGDIMRKRLKCDWEKEM